MPGVLCEYACYAYIKCSVIKIKFQSQIATPGQSDTQGNFFKVNYFKRGHFLCYLNPIAPLDF